MDIVKTIDENAVKNFTKVLNEYKMGKAHLEEKIVMNEQFWKLRHWKGRAEKHIPATAWLWNVIVNKHADMMDSFPEPSILPREANDKQEAEELSAIVPVILEQNDFKQTYDDVCWYMLKQGCGIFGVFWDTTKPLGDVTVKKIDALNLFWEPGISNIQDSRYLFHTELVDIDLVKQSYPELANVNLADAGYKATYLYDDAVDTSNKCTIVDVYYKKKSEGKTVLHYCKFCGNNVLYATENETSADVDEFGNIIGEPMSVKGWFDHGQYPFIFSSLYDIEGTPFGYGFTDICKDTQITIDEINASLVENTKQNAKPRFFVGSNVKVNLDEYADVNQQFVKASGNVDEANIKPIVPFPLNGTCITYLETQIAMMKETSGNRDVNSGGTTAGVTAASAIAALQEQGNKGSRDIVAHIYEAYKEICYQVIELIRQFYDAPRTFRITGKNGEMSFSTYTNAGIKPMYQGSEYGVDMGYRVPEFDIDVKAAKQTSYSKMAQNELMLQFYQLGFFNPQQATVSLACLQGMDFQGKDDIINTIQQNGTLQSMFMQMYTTALGLASRFEPALVPALQQMGMQAGVEMPQAAAEPNTVETDPNGNVQTEEHPFVEKARANAQNTSPA